ncbi:MAG: DNA polymerase III subunit gamma/tau, partial [Gammaproteobacteria bacterium]|nr:DNA polymerase III subunit gamma/tau [Gammaproteobacteria bacterium]
HAFLFTGTRGVGKTTIARILVKALNCEQGVGPRPCGECASCRAIDQGRFVDFLELDAASRTGVDDTRELLENAQYTPASGRFKVYLIDEVHMLSKSAFNALLKTLEEPPPHLKFLLATTDPQKIPVTVLSRCLQFSLKRLPVATIAERLSTICASEGVQADDTAIGRIARAAEGSVRDALSLLDQAIAFGDGSVRDAEVAEMLGSLDRERLTALVEALASQDGAELIDQVRQLDEVAPDYDSALGGLAALLQQIAVWQITGGSTGEREVGEEAFIARHAASLTPEGVQLLYQIAVLGRRDLPLAPDPRTGFEMTLLRMLAFQPAAAAVPVSTPAAPVSIPRGPPAAPAGKPPDTPAAAGGGQGEGDRAPAGGIADWPAFVSSLSLDGAVRQLAANCELASQSPFELRLTIAKRNAALLTDSLRTRLGAALTDRLGSTVKVHFSTIDDTANTAAARQAENEADELRRAREVIATDSNVRQMAELFGAEVIPDSVRQTGTGTRKTPKPRK